MGIIAKETYSVTIGEVKAISIGFTCQICGDIQTIEDTVKIDLPICDQCKKDLKEIIMNKRSTKHPQKQVY